MTDLSSIVRFAPLTTHNVTLPDHLDIKVTKANIIDDARPYGYDGEIFFGTAFIQGGRIMFSTAMPISTMLKVSKVDRAKAGSTVSEVMEKANRPKISGSCAGAAQVPDDDGLRRRKIRSAEFYFQLRRQIDNAGRRA